MHKKKTLFGLCILLLMTACKKEASRSVHTSSKPKSHASTPSNHPVVNKARTYLGTPYKNAGLDHKGMDCSGLSFVSYQQVGITLPRIAAEQSKKGKRIYIGQLEPGDLIFFTDKKGSSKITHVAIVSETDHPNSVTFIHASTSKGVREDELMTGYWRDLYVKAVRPE